MLVILREDIPHLGEIGDVVKVSNGYARNYLLPRKLVVQADERNLSQLDHHKRILEKKRAVKKQSAEEIAQKMGEYSCTIKRKVGKSDRLFGSVTSGDIAENLKSAGFDIEKSAIQMKDNIKALGVHPVNIKLLSDVVATVKVWVVKEDEE